MVGAGGSLAPRDGGEVKKKNELSPVSYRVLKTREPAKCSSRTGILRYVLLQCCTAVVGRPAGSG